MRTLCVYDDREKPNIFIRNIIGDKSFGEVLLKRRSVREKTVSFLQSQGAVEKVLEFSGPWQPQAVCGAVRDFRGAIIHMFSNFIVWKEQEAEVLFRKLAYAEGSYVCMCGGKPLFFAITNPERYCRFLTKYGDSLHKAEIYSGTAGLNFERLETDAFLDIGEDENFLRYISGGFDARFFNSLKGDDYTVVKTSDKRAKIRAEYSFYHLLPDEMKMWFVMPYGYREDGFGASYRMERYHVPDLAIRWVHGAVSLEEMDHLLARVFHFICIRKKKDVTPEEAERMRVAFYLEKVKNRMGQLKGHALYQQLDSYVAGGVAAGGLDAMLERYMKLYGEFSSRQDRELVIGHGDLCFSNMLYNRDTDLLKLIDPKGAEEESQLWMDPYYDIAKLSHSVCGLYDFFNSGQYRIVLDEGLRFCVEIGFDNQEYVKLFRRHVEENGFSYPLVRLYEASLFLSMLPLHMDNPHKVFGLILNAERLLGEAETCMEKR